VANWNKTHPGWKGAVRNRQPRKLLRSIRRFRRTSHGVRRLNAEVEAAQPVTHVSMLRCALHARSAHLHALPRVDLVSRG
jgi:hypothetical protein